MMKNKRVEEWGERMKREENKKNEKNEEKEGV